jgi:4-hydroxybenzoate polyprenyltransferase
MPTEPMNNIRRGPSGIARCFRSILDIYLYGSIHIALGAVGMSLMTCHLIHADLFSHPAWLSGIFFGTLAFYSFHRIYDLDKRRELADTTRLMTVARHRSVIRGLSLFSVVFASISLAFFPADQWLILVPGVILTAWYSVAPGKSLKKLREFGFVKIFVIALVWGMVTAVIPAIREHSERHVVFLLLLERSLFIFALTIPFDLRDYLTDKKQKVRTLPAFLGKKQSILLALGVLTLLLPVIILVIYRLGVYSQPDAILLIVTNIATAILVGMSLVIRNDYYFTGILDGILIFQPLVLILFNS